jgi:hypothetical protein
MLSLLVFRYGKVGVADSRIPPVGDFRFNGEVVSIINIHSSSKGGGTSLYGAVQRPVNGSEEQRIAQAEEIHAFVPGLGEENPRAAVMVLGDANEFDWNASQQALTGEADGRRGQLLFDLAVEQEPNPSCCPQMPFDASCKRHHNPYGTTDRDQILDEGGGGVPAK